MRSRDTRGEFPRSWFAGAKLADGRRNCSLNYFGVDADGSPLVVSYFVYQNPAKSGNFIKPPELQMI